MRYSRRWKKFFKSNVRCISEIDTSYVYSLFEIIPFVFISRPVSHLFCREKTWNQLIDRSSPRESFVADSTPKIGARPITALLFLLDPRWSHEKFSNWEGARPSRSWPWKRFFFPVSLYFLHDTDSVFTCSHHRRYSFYSVICFLCTLRYTNWIWSDSTISGIIFDYICVLYLNLSLSQSWLNSAPNWMFAELYQNKIRVVGYWISK
jgi:hypothetical protein